jgi:hypothetical protein
MTADPAFHGLIRCSPGEDRAVRAAGLLAELGITILTLTTAGAPPRTLATRRTDLPKELRDLSAWKIAAEGVSLTSASQGLEWNTDSAATAGKIRTTSATPSPD